MNSRAIPKIRNDLPKVLAILRFRKLKTIETVALVEEIEQLRAEVASMEQEFEQALKGAQEESP